MRNTPVALVTDIEIVLPEPERELESRAVDDLLRSDDTLEWRLADIAQLSGKTSLSSVAGKDQLELALTAIL